MELQEAPAATGRPRGHRTGMERFLIGLTVVLLVSSVVLVASLVYVVTSGSEEEAGTDKTQVAEGNRSQGLMASPRTMGQATVPEQFQGDLCVTPGCVSVASHLLRARDPSVSPCDDFFRHACGGWQRRVSQLGLTSPETDYSVNIDQPQAVIDWKLTQLLSSPKQETVRGFQRTKRFFNLCKEILPARKHALEIAADHILQHVLGGFRSASSWTAQPVQLTELLVQLHRLQAGPLFQLYGAVDPRDHSRKVAVISLPDFDPLEHAAERRHRPHGEIMRSPWLTNHPVRSLRRRRRVDSASTAPSESVDQDGETAEAGQEAASPQSYTSARFFNALKTAAVIEHINESMKFFAKDVAKSNNTEFYTEEGMIADWYEMQQFLYNFSKILPSHREQAELEINSQLQCQYSMTVEELGIDFPTVNWTRLIRETVSTDITEADGVCIPFPQYMIDLDLMLTIFSPRIVHNAVLLMYRKTRLDSMVATLSAAEKSVQASSQYCLGLVQTLYPVPLAGMFVRDAGRTRVDALKVKVSGLVSEVRDELIRAVEKRSAQTPSPVYEMALEKLRQLRCVIGASDSFWDDQFINSHAPSPSRLRTRGKEHHRLLRLANALASVDRTYTKKFFEADYHSEDTIWSSIIQPYSSNAFYIPDRNAVVIPLAFLSEPYLYDDVPRYITLAALGTTVAHELLHSIGVTGFYFDGDGELRELSETTESELSELRHCVRHQFTGNLSREVEISGLHFSAQPNGELTLDENLSDHDGLALAWRTYHRWQHRQHRPSDPEPRLPGVQTSVRQTFLLALAQTYCAKVARLSYVTSAEVDTHLPNPERINAMIRHFPGFASAFGCPEGAPMRPEHQCSPLWMPL